MINSTGQLPQFVQSTNNLNNSALLHHPVSDDSSPIEPQSTNPVSSQGMRSPRRQTDLRNIDEANYLVNPRNDDRFQDQMAQPAGIDAMRLPELDDNSIADNSPSADQLDDENNVSTSGSSSDSPTHSSSESDAESSVKSESSSNAQVSSAQSSSPEPGEIAPESEDEPRDLLDPNKHQIIIIQNPGVEESESAEGSESLAGSEDSEGSYEDDDEDPFAQFVITIMGDKAPVSSLDKVNNRESFLVSIGFDEDPSKPESVTKADAVWQKCVAYHQTKFEQLCDIDLVQMAEMLGDMYTDDKVVDDLKKRVINSCKDVKTMVLELRNRRDNQATAPIDALELPLPISMAELAQHTKTVMQSQKLLQEAGYGALMESMNMPMKSGLQVQTGSKKGDTHFSDVAGITEAKAELEEVVDYLKDPDRYIKLGAKIPRGVLLSGPPGTGKTLLAKAVAGEAGVPFFSVSGSSFVEEYVGTGAKRVRDLFSQAKAHKSCIVFIDEIDGVGRNRSSKSNGGSQEHEHTLNALLVELDGFASGSGVIVMGATNRPDMLDGALMRPGRFDRSVTIGLPQITGREEILKLHAQKISLGDDVDFNNLARRTTGYSGAELANLVNEAALQAARSGKTSVGALEFEKARDKEIMGLETPSFKLSDKNRVNTAYHESGHAIVGYFMQEHDPVYKVTIMPRGNSLGATHYTPEEDTSSISQQKLKGELACLLGGRMAEELLLGENGVTTGASNDLERASEMARNMVTQWGFSQSLGRVVFKRDRDGQKIHMAEQTAQKIDNEVKNLVDEAEATARIILTTFKDKMDQMAHKLLEQETIDLSEMKEIMADAKFASI